MPGSGKTVLAASAIEELLASENTESTCYFFFRRGVEELESAAQAYQSILAQTLWTHRRDWTLLDKYSFILDHESSGQTHATRKETMSVIQHCANTGFIQNIVLDGIDECSDSNDLVFELSQMFQNTDVRIMLFSRPHCIPPSTSLDSQMALGHSNSQDIEKFLTRKLHEFVRGGILPADVNIDTLCEPLLTGANGMFLWAHLMLTFLQSPGLTRRERIKVINSVTLPEGLDTMYDRILDLLSRHTRPDRDIARWVLTWLAFSCRPLSAVELQASLALRTADITADTDFSDIDYTILTTCASLVEKSQIYDAGKKSVVPCFCFMHLSVAEYLQSRLSNGARWFLWSAFDSHLLMARKLLQYIHTIIHEVQAPARPPENRTSTLITPTSLHARFPLGDYALLYWAKHLQSHRTGIMRVFRASISGTLAHESDYQSFPAILQLWKQDSHPYFATSETFFFELISVLSPLTSSASSLMAYIELSYLLDTANKFDHNGLIDWLKWAASPITAENPETDVNTIIQDVIDMVGYLKLLKKEWGISLQERPFIIWDEVPVFTPHRLLPTPKSMKIHSGFYTKLEGPNISSNYLCKVSEVDKNQRHIAILSIWPSALVLY